MSAASRARTPTARSAGIVIAAIAVLGTAACGEDEKRIGDERIVESLKLEQLDSNYAMGGDPFCSVERELLNDQSEVEDAVDTEDRAPVVVSRAGNVGVTAVPPFGPDCQRQARKRLNKLDPVPEEE